MLLQYHKVCQKFRTNGFLGDADTAPSFYELNSLIVKGQFEAHYFLISIIDANPMTDVVERVNEIYNSVITSEQCMERIACELGGLASDVGLKESPMAK